MKNAGHGEQHFRSIAHMRRVMQPEPADQARYDEFFHDTFGLVFWGGYLRKYSVKFSISCQIYLHQ